VKEWVLLEQPYIRDAGRSVQDLIRETVAKVGENIQVRRFARFRVGE
jgi:elongation factor Ts